MGCNTSKETTVKANEEENKGIEQGDSNVDEGKQIQEQNHISGKFIQNVFVNYA